MGEKPSLDEKYYALSKEELVFFKSQTGIQDEGQLKDHIVAIQTKAWEIYGYNCIRRFAFTKLKISRLSIYDHVLQLGRDRPGAILLDLACCFGNDARKAVADGYPIQNVIASDLRQAFWDLGHELFRSTPASCPIPFIPGDVFDPAHLAPTPPFYDPPTTPAPQLSGLTTLNPLLGHVTAIHVSSFFHLFSEEEQLALAHAVAPLLSPAPGSVLFGSHGGAREKGFRDAARGRQMFCHSPESWRELWDGTVFSKGTVKVETQLVKVERPDLDPKAGSQFWLLVWSVIRL